MRDTLVALYQLQKIDSAALEFERGALAIPKKITELESEPEVLRTDLGQINGEAEALRQEQQTLDGQVSEDGAKVQKWKRRLNDIKSPREYQALSREIEMAERQVKGFEDRIVDIMGELEAKQKVIASKEAYLREREADVMAKVGELRSAQAKLNSDAQKAKHGRDLLVAKIPDNVMKRYEQVRVRRNGIAVAVAEKGNCSGCNVSLRPQLVVELLKYSAIETCSTCNRILIHEELVHEIRDEIGTGPRSSSPSSGTPRSPSWRSPRSSRGRSSARSIGPPESRGRRRSSASLSSAPPWSCSA